MPYTKDITIKKMKHLRFAKDYAKNASKTTVDAKENTSHLDNIFPYITNEDKTVSKQLVSGYKITDVYNAAEEFIATKKIAAIRKGTDIEWEPGRNSLVLHSKKLEKRNAVLARHLVQSFSPDDDLTPEEIHEIGRKTVLELTGGEHEFIIATHTDKKHIHNHIIFNTTNLVTGNSFRWQKGTKRKFEKISDKHAEKAGAKIIEKKFTNSHKKYTLWQTENIFKSKIKSRLDFLLENSHDLADFKKKAMALNLSVDFSGKHTTYKLLDEPQIKNTRGRSLSKNHPEKYNFEGIVEKLKSNDVVLSVEEVVERYEEKIENKKIDFDYQVTLEAWQVHEITSRGFYVTVDYGAGTQGQIFIPAFKVDQLENGDFCLYLRRKDYFYLMDDKNSKRNHYMTGETFMKQLCLYNGTVPVKKEPVISSLHELVEAMNFLIEHGVNEGKQMENLEKRLESKIQEAQERLEALDEKIMNLHQSIKDTFSKEGGNEKITSSSEELQQELISSRLGRKVLVQELENAKNEFNQFREIEYSQIKSIK